MSDLIKCRRDTAANWTSENPILDDGELGAELDTGRLKFGNGADAWAALPYVDDAAGGGVTPPTIRDKASQYTNNTSTTALAVTIPATAVAGDLLVFFGAGGGASGAITGGNVSSAGWSIAQAVTGTNLQGAIAVAIATATSAGQNVSMVFGGTSFAVGHIAVIRDWTCVVGTAIAQNGTSAAVLGSPIVPSAARDGVLVLGFGCGRVNGITLASNLATNVINRNADTSLSSCLFSGSPAQMLRHVVTTGTNAALLSAAVAVSG